MKNSFDDLIDVSVKAFKDGVLGKVNMNDLGVRELRYKLKDEDSDRIVFEQHNDYSDGVDFINSLYIEEFVIESESDVKKINIKDDNAKVTLANGTELELSGSRDSSNQDGFAIGFLLSNNRINYYGITVLKGAKVTQKRGK